VISTQETEKSFLVLAEGTVSVLIDGVEVRELAQGQCVGEMEYLADIPRTAEVKALSNIVVLKIDQEIKKWASLPCQLRMNRVFQEVLIERLSATSKALARALN